MTTDSVTSDGQGRHGAQDHDEGEERGNLPRHKTTKFVHRPPQITNNVACNNV